ncbi:hypothetical protein G9A89_010904 [Geosiphon pyriformis]|nr:hypothetical protein G9A89_010904 [Geosiphon pyriformis]
MESSFNIGVKSTEPRKKRRGSALEDNISNQKFATTKVSNNHFWGSETSNTTESDSVDMEEECLVEKTSFDYGDGEAFTREGSEQMSKSSKTITKRVLRKLLGKINFLGNNNDNILLDKSVVFSLPLKNLVNVSVRKFFALNISLENVEVVFKNQWFRRRASILSKFAEIIRATFTSELSLAQASKKTEEVKILVNTNLKRSFRPVVEFDQVNHADLVTAKWSILIGKDAVHVARSDIDKELWNIQDIYRALLYTLLMGTNAHDIWNYVALVGGKTCVIDHHLVSYAQARCTTVCFDSAESLDTVMGTTLVLRSVNLHWSYLGFSKCAKCGKLGHISLNCAVNGNFSFGKPSSKSLSDIDKSKLATIYAKHSALIARPVVFDGTS